MMLTIKRVIAAVLFAFALLLLLSAFGFIGGSEASAEILNSPESSGRLLGPLIGAAFLAAGGAYLWQKPKTK